MFATNFIWQQAMIIKKILWLDFLHNKRSLSDARSKSFSFASVTTATQIILATLPSYSQNATWRSSTANTETIFFVLKLRQWFDRCITSKMILKSGSNWLFLVVISVEITLSGSHSVNSALKVFHSPVWLLLHKLSSPHYRHIRKMRRGDRLPLTQKPSFLY
jgi:hypothetical protein